jgi:hypothetical protein
LQYQGKTINVQEVYRFLDRLNEGHAALAKEIAYRHTKKLLKNIGVVFYGMTSLYFEAEDEDDLRKIGFFKDGKFQNPQIMLGLRAFRISKTDLRIRPMYHRRRRRIEAHILVAFVAYTIYKELERRLSEKNIPISPKRAAELTQTMYEMTFRYPGDPEDQHILLQMDEEQRLLLVVVTRGCPNVELRSRYISEAGRPNCCRNVVGVEPDPPATPK